VPNKNKLSAALSKLKYLVIMDPLETETSEFWQNHGEFNDVEPESIQTEVFRLPTTCFAEEEGSLSTPAAWRSGRKRIGLPGEAKTDSEIMALLFLAARDVRQGRRRLPRAHPQPGLGLRAAQEPSSAELLREINGKALADVQAPADPANPTAPRAVLVKAGQQLPGFAMLRDDGSTACGCWIYCGAWTEAGNLMARRAWTTRPAWACTAAWAIPGRPTAASCTTAPAPTPAASPGRPTRSTSTGTARPGPAPTCPT
jgi:formate dehydrogenase major subunit